MNTGENEQALRGIIDFIRLGSIFLLLVHFYIYCYAAFEGWHLTQPWIKDLLLKIGRSPFIHSPFYIKAGILLLLIISLFGLKGKKDETSKPGIIFCLISGGLICYWCSPLLLQWQTSVSNLALAYVSATSLGYLLLLSGGARISRLIRVQLDKDVFNTINESFPQEERYRANEYSINFPGKYSLRGKIRRSWINCLAPFRSSLIVGSGGSGKSYFIIRHYITQMISKGYTMLLYDFKYDDLSKIAYNALLKYRNNYKVPPRFFVINFDDPSRTHRCNPLEPQDMEDIADAAEASRTILLALNRDWIKKSGEFFTESAINFVTAIFWFLKTYEGGRYCTLPHAIELSGAHYDDLFPLLGTEETVSYLVNAFVSAYLGRAMEQLEGQVASARIALGRLVSPAIYWVLSGNDFSLDINNPKDPKIVCLGNNPKRVQTYGAVLSLYVTRVARLVTKKGQEPSAIVVDELPTIFWNGVENLIGIARGYRCAIVLAVQDISQLKKDYSREQAEVIVNICGNIYCGQAVGETAKLMSERIGKIVQPRDSVSINRTDTSVSKSTQLDSAIPPSRIAQLSSGEFVGLMADTPSEIIERKPFHCHFQNDHAALAREEAAYKDIPFETERTPEEVNQNFFRIRREVELIIADVLEKIRNTPSLAHLLFIKPDQ